MIKSAVGTKHPPSEDGESEGWSPNRTSNRPTKRREVYKPFPDAVRSEEEFVKDWGITPDEEDKRLADLRRVVEQAAGTLRPIFDDLYMRRFLRARGHDVAEAKKMFMRHLKWRQEYGCEGVLEDFVFEERDAVLTIYPQGYHKTDRLGRPIYIQHLGQVDLRKLTAITSEDRMIRFHVQEYERALKYIFPGCSVVAGRAVTQTLAIVDLKGVGLRHLAGDTKRILGDIVRIDSDNYPETLGNTVIINAPGVFKLLWNIVKPMLDTRTQAKIHVASSNYMPDLLKWVDEDSIPAYLGGKSKGSLVDDIGPWQDPAVIATVERMIASRDGLVSPGSHPRSESYDSGSPKGEAAIPAPLSRQQQLKKEQPPLLHPSANGGSQFLTPMQSLASSAGSGALTERGSSLAGPLAGEPGGPPPRPPAPSPPRPPEGDGPDRAGSGLRLPSRASSGSARPGPSPGFARLPPGQARAPSRHEDGSDSEEAFFDARARRVASTTLSVVSGDETDFQSPVGADSEFQSVRGDAFSEAGGAASPDRPATPGRLGAAAHRAGSAGEGGRGGGPFAAASPSRDWRAASSGQPSWARDVPSMLPSLQTSILARVRALEQRLPAIERPLKKQLPDPPPSAGVGTGTLLGRVAALESAVSVLLHAQERALDKCADQTETDAARAGCCGCSLM